MKMIQPNCRVQFTAQDVDFILQVLGRKIGTADCLVKLLADEDSRDLILDDETLFHALIEQRGCLRVSSRFYFYMLVRHVFKRSDLNDRALADYVAEVLTAFSESRQSECILPGQINPLDYFFEMVSALQTADERTSFQLRLHIGNHSLFLAGVFPERIRARAETRGFPSLRYYEQLGRTHYRIAGEHRLAQRYQLDNVLCTLSERFQSARRALNDMADRLFSIGEGDYPLHLLFNPNKPE
ncbi:MAG TPA: hypothetical protein VH413_07330 [Verrucomicrobiae bacterium]|nr:hypothetical protein [Verrucomicrobiae bacterium]